MMIKNKLRWLVNKLRFERKSWYSKLLYASKYYGTDTPKGKTLSHRQKPLKGTSGNVAMVNDNADEAEHM